MRFKIIETEDGSHTLYVPNLDEHYHSSFGAIQESDHVFIKEGLFTACEIFTDINILEVGFGTGLNALLTFLRMTEMTNSINYHAIEAFPLELEITDKLNYPDLLKISGATGFFKSLHRAQWNIAISLSDQFGFMKSRIKIEDVSLEANHYHLVYFDAFAPDVQPELWEQDIFDKIVRSMTKNGILVTYSAKGSVRRCMQSAGLEVERIPGPPGKREMLRGRKIG